MQMLLHGSGSYEEKNHQQGHIFFHFFAYCLMRAVKSEGCKGDFENNVTGNVSAKEITS